MNYINSYRSPEQIAAQRFAELYVAPVVAHARPFIKADPDYAGVTWTKDNRVFGDPAGEFVNHFGRQKCYRISFYVTDRLNPMWETIIDDIAYGFGDMMGIYHPNVQFVKKPQAHKCIAREYSGKSNCWKIEMIVLCQLQQHK